MPYRTGRFCYCPVPRPGHEAVKHSDTCFMRKIIASSACPFCGAAVGTPCMDGTDWIMPGIHDARKSVPVKLIGIAFAVSFVVAANARAVDLPGHPYEVAGCRAHYETAEEALSDHESSLRFFRRYRDARAYAEGLSRSNPNWNVALWRVDAHDERMDDVAEFYRRGRLEQRTAPRARECSTLPDQHPCTD